MPPAKKRSRYSGPTPSWDSRWDVWDGGAEGGGGGEKGVGDPEAKAEKREGRDWEIVGVDEAGRGALAGPVVVGACSLPRGATPAGLRDSKRMTEKQREACFAELVEETEGSVCVVTARDAPDVDERNVLRCTLEAMDEAVEAALFRLAMGCRADGKAQCKVLVLVDGDTLPPGLAAAQERVVRGVRMEVRARAMVDGDQDVVPIAAASVLAKVSRDRFVSGPRVHGAFPKYGFARHKGYGSAAHLEALRSHGSVPGLHRASFLRKHADVSARVVPAAGRDDFSFLGGGDGDGDDERQRKPTQ